MPIIVNTDGAARGNPGPSGIAFVIQGIGDQPIEYGAKIGHATNNQAEYQALIAALHKLNDLHIESESIDFFMDSELIIKQLLGEYRVRDLKIRISFEQAQDLISKLEKSNNQINFIHVKRHLNKRADALVNQALDS